MAFIPRIFLMNGYWEENVSQYPFHNLLPGTYPLMARYRVDFETPVNSVISLTLYCLVR